MTTPIETIVEELNRLNGQSVPATDLTVQFMVADPDTGVAKAQVVPAADGSLAGRGWVVTRYSQLDFDAIFSNLPATLLLQPATTIHGILESLRRNYGVDLTSDDIQGGPITWVDGQASFSLVPVTNSPYYFNSHTVNATAASVQLSDLYTNPVVSVSALVTPQTIVDALNTVNSVYVPFSAVVVGTPAVNQNTAVAENTVLELTAVGTSGFAGTVSVYYNRAELSTVVDMSSLSVLDDVATGWDLVPYFTELHGDVITTADIVDSEIDYSTLPSIYTVTAAPGSYGYIGTVDLDVKRRQDYVQQIVVNLTADDTAFTTQKLIDLITPQVVSVVPSNITINVAANVIIVGASAATPTLVLGKYAGLTDVRYTIVNRGSIYGRGGNGGAAQTSAVAGGKGGDAINVADSSILVSINNLGRILGGGGGGACETNSGVRGLGGGGAPYGVSSGGTATTQTSYSAGTSATNYPIQSNGGRGGDVGMAGGSGTMVFTSNGALGHTTAGGAAGAVVSGETAGVTWVNKGLRLPFQTDDVLPTGITNASISRTYPDPTGATMLTIYLGSVTAGSTILSVANLAAAVGLTVGAAGTNTTFFMVYIDGKFLLMPTQPVRTGISYTQLYNLGLVDGDGTTGKNPPDGAALVTQNKAITYNSQQWAVRLFGGSNDDPVPEGTSHIGTAATDTLNSEWNRLFYNLTTEVFADQPGNKWASSTDTAMLLAYNSVNNGYALMKERHAFDGTDRRVTRGGGDSATDTYGTGTKRIGAAPVATASYQWRPALELRV